jgi:hypothetical protein
MVNIIKKILLVVLSLVFVFAALEGGIRLTKHRSVDIYQEDKDQYISRKYQSNLDIMHLAEGGNTVHTVTNSLGFIGEDFQEMKEEGVIRVVNLGDSMTAGIDVDYNKTYSALLGNTLTDTLETGVESFNFGIAGQSTGHVFMTYKHYARNFNPDVVIYWAFLGNDFEETLTYEEGIQDGFDENASFLKRMARKSELAYLVVNRLARVPFFARLMHGTVLTRIGLDEIGDTNGLPLGLRVTYTEDKESENASVMMRKYLDLLSKETANDKKELLVVMIPESWQVEEVLEENLLEQYPKLLEIGFDNRKPNKDLGIMFDDLMIDYIDLTPLFKDVCDKDPVGVCGMYTRPHGHLSEKGHELASKTAAEYILENFLQDKQVLTN